MSSVLVLGSCLSGKFRKRRDGTTKCRPSSSLPRTDGLPRCEHWVGRWEGGKVGRWEGGKVGRWEGGKVGRWEGEKEERRKGGEE